MTNNDIISIAYDCNAMPESCTDAALILLSKTIYNLALSDATEVLLAMLYPNPNTHYQEQYNDGIRSKVKRILELSENN